MALAGTAALPGRLWIYNNVRKARQSKNYAAALDFGTLKPTQPFRNSWRFAILQVSFIFLIRGWL